jgi:hypothetical protein
MSSTAKIFGQRGEQTAQHDECRPIWRGFGGSGRHGAKFLTLALEAQPNAHRHRLARKYFPEYGGLQVIVATGFVIQLMCVP